MNGLFPCSTCTMLPHALALQLPGGVDQNPTKNIPWQGTRKEIDLLLYLLNFCSLSPPGSGSESAPHSSVCSSTNSSKGSELPLSLPPPFFSECSINYQYLNILPCHAVSWNGFLCLLGLPGPHWRLVFGEGLSRYFSGSPFQHESSAEGGCRRQVMDLH